ncbi:unnamed protein product [Trichobilharzia regenti]|nr:unnamed protein product [Trichobilharzia regenti]
MTPIWNNESDHVTKNASSGDENNGTCINRQSIIDILNKFQSLNITTTTTTNSTDNNCVPVKLSEVNGDQLTNDANDNTDEIMLANSKHKSNNGNCETTSC